MGPISDKGIGGSGSSESINPCPGILGGGRHGGGG